jgi:hypothetical protein
VKGLFKATGVLAGLAAILAAGGLHWLLLQSVAWGLMLADYARTDSLPAAIEKTLDGRHPCPRCRAIQKGRQAENRARRPELRLERLPETLWLLRAVRVPPRPQPDYVEPAYLLRPLPNWACAPPKPPPKHS